MTEQQKKEVLPNCDICDHSYMGYFESSSNYSLKCSMYESECSYQCKRGCNSFSDKAGEIIELKNKLEAEKAKVERLKTSLSNAIMAADFFKNHADCTRESYFSCTCSFCKLSNSKEDLLRICRQTLKEIEG